LIFILPSLEREQAVWWQYLFPLPTLLCAGMLWLVRKAGVRRMAAFLFLRHDFPGHGLFLTCTRSRVFFVADHFNISLIGPIAIVAAGIEIGIRFITGKPAALSATDAVCNHTC